MDGQVAQGTAGRTTPSRRRRVPSPMCPLRPGEPCTLCQPGATGPQDCATVWLVKDDPDLHQAWLQARASHAARRRAAVTG